MTIGKCQMAVLHCKGIFRAESKRNCKNEGIVVDTVWSLLRALRRQFPAVIIGSVAFVTAAGRFGWIQNHHAIVLGSILIFGNYGFIYWYSPTGDQNSYYLFNTLFYMILMLLPV